MSSSPSVYSNRLLRSGFLDAALISKWFLNMVTVVGSLAFAVSEEMARQHSLFQSSSCRIGG